ncbi:sugar-binding transcriptional regulator [Bacillaceae bacterium W0354]
MSEWFQLQQKLVPDLLKTIDQRYSILKSIEQLQPIGRRALAEYLNKTERQIRSEIEFLDEQGLVDVTNKGMFVSLSGKAIVDNYPNVLREMTDINVLEKRLKHLLRIEHVYVVSGNADQSEEVKQVIGQKAAEILMNYFHPHTVVSVTGGSTVAAVADYLKPINHVKPLFVPARGGLGRNYEYQASSICVKMANNTDGDYRLLHIPDTVSAKSYESMKDEPEVKEVIDLIDQADLVVHGVGHALKMAERRHTSVEILDKLNEEGAVGEAFGYYFDKEGNTIHKVNSIGIKREQLLKVNCVVTVAGGRSKGEALFSFFKWGKSDVLITDEAAANELIKKLESK